MADGVGYTVKIFNRLYWINIHEILNINHRTRWSYNNAKIKAHKGINEIHIMYRHKNENDIVKSKMGGCAPNTTTAIRQRLLPGKRFSRRRCVKWQGMRWAQKQKKKEIITLRGGDRVAFIRTHIAFSNNIYLHPPLPPWKRWKLERTSQTGENQNENGTWNVDNVRAATCISI